MVLFCYYLLGSNTAAPIGLLARLCHTLVVIFFNMSKAISVSTGPTFTIFSPKRTCSIGAEVSQDPLDRFSQSLHHMVDVELQMINPTFFFDILRDVAMATNFMAKLPTPLHLSLWHSGTEWDNAMYMHD